MENKVVLWKRSAPRRVIKREVITGIARADVDEANRKRWAEAVRQQLIKLGLAALEEYRLTAAEAAARVLAYPEGKKLAEDAARFGLTVDADVLARWLLVELQ